MDNNNLFNGDFCVIPSEYLRKIMNPRRNIFDSSFIFIIFFLFLTFGAFFYELHNPSPCPFSQKNYTKEKIIEPESFTLKDIIKDIMIEIQEEKNSQENTQKNSQENPQEN